MTVGHSHVVKTVASSAAVGGGSTSSSESGVAVVVQGQGAAAPMTSTAPVQTTADGIASGLYERSSTVLVVVVVNVHPTQLHLPVAHN